MASSQRIRLKLLVPLLAFSGVLFAVMGASNAFITGPRSSPLTGLQQIRSSQAVGGAALPAIVGTPNPASARDAGTTWQYAGSALFLLASLASVCRSRSQRKVLRISRPCVMFLDAPCTASSREPAVQRAASTPVPTASETESFPMTASNVAPAATVAVLGKFTGSSYADRPVEVGCAAPSPKVPRSFFHARRVGSARYASRVHRASYRAGFACSGAEKAERRKTGVRLCQKAVHPSPSASYDPSRLDMKMQLGLQTSARVRSASGRESKTQSVSRGTTKSSGVYILGSNFQIMEEMNLYKQRKDNISVDGYGGLSLLLHQASV